jgi:5-methylcytosine-specific restriction enzyme subunit McrC
MTPSVLQLIEYKPLLLNERNLSTEFGKQLWHNYDKTGVIKVEFPTPKTDNQWQLTAQGWIGHIPLTENLSLHLQPKVPLKNVFGMLDYAYSLKSFQFLEGLTHCDSIENLFDLLAGVLARLISDRSRKGLYRTYISQTNHQGFIRGRLDMSHLIRKPWATQIQCHYKEQTADIEDNQILLWTLRQIAFRLPQPSPNLPRVRRAYHTLQNTVTLTPTSPRACLNRQYNRLNNDYQPLHALCRFFLEQCGPDHEWGDRKMLPFLVNMARLYELFVAEWLKANSEKYLAPHNLEVKTQERVYLDDAQSFHFNIDLVLVDTQTGKTRYVLDTKYKAPDSPSSDDTAKIIAYATTQNCSEAVLVYPQPLSKPLNTNLQNIRVRCLTFAIDSDIEQSGKAFLQELFRQF